MTRSIALAVLFCSLLPSLAAAQSRVIDGALPVVTSVSSTVVEATPRPDRAALRAMLAERRRAHLAELRRYVRQGDFPVNGYQEGMLNVFVDESGHLCAVANLMAFDGRIDMVRATAASTNFVVLRDVREGPLHDWILSSGFTQEEIGMIQEPYFFQEQLSSQQEMRRRLEEEKARIRGVLRAVIHRLEEAERASLDLAVDRLVAAGAVS